MRNTENHILNQQGQPALVASFFVIESVIRFIDMFSGIGGFREGLTRAEFCTAGDADPVTLQIQKACAEYKPTEEFPETFYKEVVSKVILYRDTHIEFKLQNGQIV